MPTIRERLEFVAGRALGALSPGLQARLLREPPTRIDGGELDPGIQLMLAIRRANGVDALVPTPRTSPRGEPDAARAAVLREARLHAGTPTPVGRARDLEIQGAAGPLRARHYAPVDEGAGARPLVVFFHGGGWVLCDLDTHDEPCRLLCRHAGVHVLSVAYRLAPEHPFPAGVDDAFAALRWAAAHARELGADPTCIALAGDSAGGNLAAVTAQRARDAGGPPLAVQLLIYPAVDWVERRASRDLFGRGLFLTEEEMTWCEGHYLGAGADRADARLSPLRATDLGGLPRAIVITAAFNPLRDEGEAYARALAAAGTATTLRRYAGLIHGFFNMTKVNRTSRDAVIEAAGMLRLALERPC